MLFLLLETKGNVEETIFAELTMEKHIAYSRWGGRTNKVTCSRTVRVPTAIPITGANLCYDTVIKELPSTCPPEALLSCAENRDTRKPM